MRLVTGDECGFLKECLPSVGNKKQDISSDDKKSVTVFNKDEGVRVINSQDRPSRRRGVVDLAWCSSTRFASLRMDGTVQLWEQRRRDTNDNVKEEFGKYHQVTELTGVFEKGSSSDSIISPMTRPLGLSNFGADGRSQLVACNAQGQVTVMKTKDDSDDSLSVVRMFTTFDTTTSESSSSQYPLVGCMGVHASNGWIGVGGKDRETTVYDLESAGKVWKAKNLPPHPQTLLQPIVWPSALLFLPDNKNSHLLAVGSDLQVRLYDVRVDAIQRRPIAHTPQGLLNQRVTSFCLQNEHDLVVGDTAGYLYTLDLRNLSTTSTANQSRLVGPAGSIRQLVKHASLSRMAAVGLDRMLRIYDTKSRKQTTCMYLKQRLNCVLFDDKDSDLEEKSNNSNEEDFDAVDSDSDQEDVVQDYVDSDKERDQDSEDEDEESSSVDSDKEAGDHEADDHHTNESSENSEDDESEEEGDEDCYASQPRKRQRK